MLYLDASSEHYRCGLDVTVTSSFDAWQVSKTIETTVESFAIYVFETCQLQVFPHFSVISVIIKVSGLEQLMIGTVYRQIS